MAISNRRSRSDSAAAEGVHTPTEEDAIRRLRSSLPLSVVLALALGLSACADPQSLEADGFGAAGVASIGASTGFAISGAEPTEGGGVALHGIAAPGTLVHIGEHITVAGELGTWTLTFEVGEDGTTVTIVAEGPDGQLETMTVDLADLFDEPKDDGPGDDPDDEGGDDHPVEISVVQKRSTSDAEHPSALFKGTAPPGTGILGTSEYGVEDTRAGEDGTFVLEIPIHGAPIGEPFGITVFVGDDYEFHGEFTWTREEPSDEPTEDPKPVEVTARQYKGQSDSPEPWEKFYGTAPSGTKISVHSEYGSASGYAGSNGEYLVKVWFDGLETTTTFPITVWVGDRRFSFSYSWYAPAWEASAHQKWGECEADNAYDVFYGTGRPGTKVRIVSEYGSAELFVGEKGGWEKKVYFTGAPRGTEFPVTVWVGEQKFQFSFTALEIVHETWAAQKWELVDGESPWNKYYGHGDPGETVTISSDYGSKQFTIGSSGEWLKEVSFDPPSNTWFAVTVTIGDGYSKTFEMKWVHEEPADVAFTVSQVVGQSHSLREVFWGSTDPGTKVVAESEFGGGSTYANENGDFEFGIDFSGVEANTTFTIWVSNQGETKTFTFTYLGPESS